MLPFAAKGRVVIEVQFFIPVADNSGVPFPHTTDDLFLVELDGLFGGSSVLAGSGAGRSAPGGQTDADQNRLFMVSVTGLLADGPKVLAAVARAKSLYAQLALTVRYLNMAEIL